PSAMPCSSPKRTTSQASVTKFAATIIYRHPIAEASIMRPTPQRWTTMLTLFLLALVLLLGVGISAAQDATEAAASEAGQASAAGVYGERIRLEQFVKRSLLQRVLLIQQLNNVIKVYPSLGYTPEQIKETVTYQPPYSTWYNQLQNAGFLGDSVLDTLI